MGLKNISSQKIESYLIKMGKNLHKGESQDKSKSNQMKRNFAISWRETIADPDYI